MKPTRDTEPMILFGTRLRRLRQEHRYTQQAVAERLCVDRTTYNKYEAGKVSPDQQGLVRLADMFNVTVDELLGRDPSSTMQVAEREGSAALSEQEQMLLQLFRQLSTEEQSVLVEQVQKSLYQRRK